MICACGGQTKVVDSRASVNDQDTPLVSRRRRCLDCGERFTTYEFRVENPKKAARRKPQLRQVRGRRNITCVSDEEALRRMREPRTALHLAAIWDIGLPAARDVLRRLEKQELIEEAPNDSVHSSQRMWVRKRKSS